MSEWRWRSKNLFYFYFYFFTSWKFKFILFRLLTYEDKLNTKKKHFLPDATFLFPRSSPSSIMIPLIIIVTCRARGRSLSFTEESFAFIYNMGPNKLKYHGMKKDFASVFLDFHRNVLNIKIISMFIASQSWSWHALCCQSKAGD